MCEHGTDIVVRVKVPADLSCDGVEKWKDVGIDACIAPIVAALQTGGIDMRGSCCGHGRLPGHIDLQDGRGLFVLSVAENAAYLVLDPNRLTADEEKRWRSLRSEPNTRADWEDLNASIVAYKRRRIARADASRGKTPAEKGGE